MTAGTVRTTGWLRQLFDVESGQEVNLSAALDVYHSRDRDRTEAALERASVHGVGFDYRLRIDSDDERRWVQVIGESEIEDGEITLV